MVKPPEHLEETQCAWCPSRVRYIQEGVRNEKAEGFDLRMSGWVHLSEGGDEIVPGEEAFADSDEAHDPTPLKGWT